MRWVDQSGPVHSLFYAGENYQGHATEVFAFYASPRTLGKAADGKTKFPGVVLIHGGGGTAFAEWAWLWAQRGYAAIAMDLSGRQPNRSGLRSEDRRTRAESGGDARRANGCPTAAPIRDTRRSSTPSAATPATTGRSTPPPR